MPDTLFPPPERQEPLASQRLAEAVRILTMHEPARQRFAVPAPWVQRERILFIAGPTAIHADAEAFASRRSCDLVVVDQGDPLSVRIDLAVFIDAIALHLWFTDYRLWRSPEDGIIRDRAIEPRIQAKTNKEDAHHEDSRRLLNSLLSSLPMTFCIRSQKPPTAASPPAM